MKKGIIIGIVIVIVIFAAISVYSVIDQNSNTIDEVIPSDVIPKTTGVNHSIELTEGITMTAP